MTEKLKSLMHERAAMTEFEIPDIDRLVREGTRRSRRRGLAVVGGGAAAATAAVVIGVAALSGGPGGDSGPTIATDPLGVDSPSYARGSVIHAGDESVEVGHLVRAYVRTRVGYVVADPSGTVWSVAGGDVSEIGSTDAERPRLVADPEGSLTGWVDGSGDTPAFVTFDQSTGDTVRNDDATDAGMGRLADEADPAYFYAIDGHTAYWRDLRGLVAFDVPTGVVSVIDADARNGFAVLAVEDGILATDGGDAGTLIRGAGRDLTLPDVYSSLAVFSPDARWISVDADQPEIFDARTGERVPIALDAWFATGYEWLDDDTVALLKADDKRDPLDLMTCEVPSGTCEVSVADLGGIEAFTEGYALPVGEHLAD